MAGGCSMAEVEVARGRVIHSAHTRTCRGEGLKHLEWYDAPAHSTHSAVASDWTHARWPSVGWPAKKWGQGLGRRLHEELDKSTSNQREGPRSRDNLS